MRYLWGLKNACKGHHKMFKRAFRQLFIGLQMPSEGLLEAFKTPLNMFFLGLKMARMEVHHTGEPQWPCKVLMGLVRP